MSDILIRSTLTRRLAGVATLGLTAALALTGFAPTNSVGQTPPAPPEALVHNILELTLHSDDTFDIVQRMAMTSDAASLMGFEGDMLDDDIEWMQGMFDDLIEQGEVLFRFLIDQPGFVGTELMGTGIALNDLFWFTDLIEVEIERDGDIFEVFGEADFTWDDDDDITTEERTIAETLWSAVSITFPGEVATADGLVSGNTVSWFPQPGYLTPINARGSAEGSGSAAPTPVDPPDIGDCADGCGLPTDSGWQAATPATLPDGHSAVLVFDITVRDDLTFDAVVTYAVSEEILANFGYSAEEFWHYFGIFDAGQDAIFAKDDYLGYAAYNTSLSLTQMRMVLPDLTLNVAGDRLSLIGTIDQGQYDTSDLLESAINENTWVEVHITLPGEIIYPVYARPGNTVIWGFPGGGLIEFYASAYIDDAIPADSPTGNLGNEGEPSVPAQPSEDCPDVLPTFFWVAIGAAGGAVIAGIVVLILRKRQQPTFPAVTPDVSAYAPPPGNPEDPFAL
ncbi:MAG: hypothetical protein FWD83_03870 [Promicromonosporaceae bacterium]|nr:hypothetical protein [Promicromonosporaceae bacterium]